MMTFKKLLIGIIKFPVVLILWIMLLPLSVHASFIESTQGAAVINDATASYYNPAALVLLKNRQIITQGTVARFRTQFSGQSTSLLTNVTESGNSSSSTHYFSPSVYFGLPVTARVIAGLAIVSNSADRDAEEGSLLRYVQASNRIQDCDVVPALAIKINEFFSIGAGINFSYASFDLKPINGIPGSNIADSQSNNQSDGTGVGGNAGFLLQPSTNTVIGFNYRSRTTYHLSGSSVYEGNPEVVSNDYHYTSWTPARSIFSINHFVTKKLGFISTVQRLQSGAITSVHVYGIANVIGTTPVILNGITPHYLRDTWMVTLGTHYRIKPNWIIRVASSYNQSPANPHYQIASGDSIVLGASMGYDINKNITIDGSYAHVFLKEENIAISGSRFLISGVNQGSRDAVSLKLTFNV